MAYGIEVYNSSGTKMVGIDSSLGAIVAQGSVTVDAYGTSSTIPITGMEDNDFWSVVLYEEVSSIVYYATISSGGFVLNNASDSQKTLKYLVVRTS